MDDKDLQIDDRYKFLKHENVIHLGMYNGFPVYKLKEENSTEKKVPFSYYYDKTDSIELVEDKESINSIGILYDEVCYSKYSEIIKGSNWEYEYISNLKSNIKQILENPDNINCSYREILITILFRKSILVCELAKDVKSNLELFSYNDYLVAICFRHNIKLCDAKYVFYKENFESILNNSKNPRDYTIFDLEFALVRDFSKCLKKEITERLKNDDKTPLIIDYFGPLCSLLVSNILTTCSGIFKNDITGEIRFVRNDSSIHIMEAEFSLTWEESTTGFSGRYVINKDDAIFYVFDEEICVPCYTEGVVKPLSVAYISADGTINEIIDREAFDTTPYVNKYPSKYMLEVLKGSYETLNIHVGDKVYIERMKTYLYEGR